RRVHRVEKWSPGIRARPILVEFETQTDRDAFLARADTVSRLSNGKYGLSPDKPKMAQDIGKSVGVSFPNQSPKPMKGTRSVKGEHAFVVIEDILDNETLDLVPNRMATISVTPVRKDTRKPEHRELLDPKQIVASKNLCNPRVKTPRVKQD
ncbi:MAG: hypothetical protein ACRDDF_02570, partial [Aeromonas sp.]